MSWRTDRGQATVEAAFLIPVLFVVLLMLVQPGIILYDRMVMNYAAAEGCRLLATKTDAGGMDDGRYRELVLRHLGAIPPQDLFHIHDGGCSYEIELSGDEGSALVAVKITNRVKLLPLFDAGAVLAGASHDGTVEIAVEQTARTKAPWLGTGASGLDPQGWVHERD